MRRVLSLVSTLVTCVVSQLAEPLPGNYFTYPPTKSNGPYNAAENEVFVIGSTVVLKWVTSFPYISCSVVDQITHNSSALFTNVPAGTTYPWNVDVSSLGWNTTNNIYYFAMEQGTYNATQFFTSRSFNITDTVPSSSSSSSASTPTSTGSPGSSSTAAGGGSGGGKKNSSGGLSTGATIGIGVGVGVGGAALLLGLGFLLWRSRRNKKDAVPQNDTNGWDDQQQRPTSHAPPYQQQQQYDSQQHYDSQRPYGATDTAAAYYKPRAEPEPQEMGGVESYRSPELPTKERLQELPAQRHY